MKDMEKLRNGFYKEGIQRRTGEIGATLFRFSEYVTNDQQRELAAWELDDSILFLTWMKDEVSGEKAERFRELLTLLKEWQTSWAGNWSNQTMRKLMAEQARLWSDRLIEMSGLLYETPNVVLKVAEPKP